MPTVTVSPASPTTSFPSSSPLSPRQLPSPLPILLSLLIPLHSLTKRSRKALRGHVHSRDKRTSETAGATRESRCICTLSYSFREGPDLPCSVARRRRRPQGCSQCLHKGRKSHPGLHGQRRIQGGERSGKARFTVEGVHRLSASEWHLPHTFCLPHAL